MTGNLDFLRQNQRLVQHLFIKTKFECFVFHVTVFRFSVRVLASTIPPLRSDWRTPTKGFGVQLIWPEQQISYQIRHRSNKCYTMHCLTWFGSEYRGPGWHLCDLF